MIGMKDQYFGVEVEMTGITREQRRRLPTTLEQSLTMWEADMINGA